jgi:hypothetical protein
MRAVCVLLIPLVALIASSTHAATPVAGCGGTYSGAAELVADLDCTGVFEAVVLEKNASLALNGFTIKGAGTGVKCLGKCTITGPGTIGENGLGISAYGKLAVVDVDVDHNTNIGIQCFTNCKVTGGSISDTAEGGLGIASTRKLELEGVTITNNWIGALARNFPKHHGTLVARNTVFSGNVYGAVSDKTAKLTDSTVTGNAIAGVVLGDIHFEQPPCPGGLHPVKLKNTAVTGNGGGAGCTTEACADLLTCKRPNLDGLSTCGTSHVHGSGLPGADWDVCTAD